MYQMKGARVKHFSRKGLKPVQLKPSEYQPPKFTLFHFWLFYPFFQLNYATNYISFE